MVIIGVQIGVQQQQQQQQQQQHHHHPLKLLSALTATRPVSARQPHRDADPPHMRTSENRRGINPPTVRRYMRVGAPNSPLVG